MRKLQSFQVETRIGGGLLQVFEKTGRYFAQFHGLSGLAHEKIVGQETPFSRPIDFELDDTSLENLIKKCRLEIEMRDSAITK